MKRGFEGWAQVAVHLQALANGHAMELNEGQRASLCAIARRLPHNGVIIADEVGMGKTRVAVAVARSVIAAGGRVAILVPPGLGYQWGDELSAAGVEAPLILRSLKQMLRAWERPTQSSPWFDEKAVVISHAFSHWRLGEASAAWRWALLPELYARWRKHTKGRVPDGYRNNENLRDTWVRNAAQSIVTALAARPAGHPARNAIEELLDNTPWRDALAAGEYGRNAQLRPWLERAVGLGLGVHDLVITDEAHKSRGQDSGLNRLLDHVVLPSADARRVALTATPVELNAEQWKQMLGRIQIDAASVSETIAGYAEAVRKLRQCPSDAGMRQTYQAAAMEFQKALDPYLLRRDKREDPCVREFERLSGEGFHAYRREKEILIATATLPHAWKQAVCAAEALSLVTRLSDDVVAKRLRLTLANGHGVAAWMDQLLDSEEGSSEQDEALELEDGLGAERGDKRLARVQWWKNRMIQPAQAGDGGDLALYDHPAVQAAVHAIEKTCDRGEKVLVFGRFTRPLRALVELLNARAMLRNLDEGQDWPQSRVPHKEWAAVVAAHRQLRRPGALEREVLDTELDRQYRRLEQQRRRMRENLVTSIEEGMRQAPPSQRVQALFDAFKQEATAPAGNEEHSLAIVARAVQGLIGPGIESAVPGEFASAFSDLIEAACDRDEVDANGEGELDESVATALWQSLEARLREEYSHAEGGFARLMYGGTRPATRRFLQLGFNHRHGHPKVLVAQSVVGREGLNLHKACRTVVLLHPEWNPGVVEQQIGRVDRMGSLWETLLKDAIGNGMQGVDLPRIEVCPVVFQGTYDEQNWQVLRDRWDELRSQLHGVVIPARVARQHAGAEAMVAEINALAPRFSPTGREFS